jgi:hypothetical protein
LPRSLPPARCEGDWAKAAISAATSAAVHPRAARAQAECLRYPGACDIAVFWLKSASWRAQDLKHLAVSIKLSKEGSTIDAERLLLSYLARNKLMAANFA